MIAHSQMISFLIFYFYIMIILTNHFWLLFYSDVRIWPDVPELTLTSGADLTLKCTGDVPVKWNQNQYDPSLLIEKVRINDL